MGNVVQFPRREPVTTRIRREPIADHGLRVAVEIVHGEDERGWVIVEALVPKRRSAAVASAIMAAAE